jgi:hypothetical protein
VAKQTGDTRGKTQDIIVCFVSFPKFGYDLDLLIAEGVIKHDAHEQYEWLKSKTSLAEYFKSIAKVGLWVPGGFWSPIEGMFEIKRGTLRKLAGHNANVLKPPESRDFIKIKALIQQHDNRIRQQQREKTVFDAVKKLIGEVEDDNPEKIHEFYKKIRKYFP